jgi:hypothetical protein
MSLKDEIEANFDRFVSRTDDELARVRASLTARRSVYLDCYVRIAALNGWRELLLSNTISASSLAFFLEAQNDALTALVFARFGSWRSANKSLRDCIENILFCLYYKDHSVELKLWHLGQFRIGFSAAHKYLKEHPDIRRVSKDVTGLEQLKSEYATLSKAVHGAHVFRMSGGPGATRLWSDEVASGKCLAHSGAQYFDGFTPVAHQHVPRTSSGCPTTRIARGAWIGNTDFEACRVATGPEGEFVIATSAVKRPKIDLFGIFEFCYPTPGNAVSRHARVPQGREELSKAGALAISWREHARPAMRQVNRARK